MGHPSPVLNRMDRDVVHNNESLFGTISILRDWMLEDTYQIL